MPDDSDQVPPARDETGRGQRVHRSAQAATSATHDAQSAARSASETSLAALQAAISAASMADRARDTTAGTVAAAAVVTADLAAVAATAVETAAAARARTVASSALAALESIATQLPDGVDPAVARLAAASVAARVAADVIAQEHSTAEAARIVAAAVTMAAEATALAAAAAAETVALAAGSAAESGDGVARSSALSEAASERAAESSTYVRRLAMRAAADLDAPPLAAELQQALLRDELMLHYQPQYRLDTGDFVAVEALLRWENPTRGLLPPSEFLGVAESHPLLTIIGDWVLETAIVQAGSWFRQAGESSPQVWVNVSCEQFDQRHLPALVARLLDAHGVPAAKLGIELTERQVAQRVDAVAADLESLHDLGVSLAVDDFGTGYASLDYLRRFTFDEIKIDRAFVTGIGQNRTDTAVASSIVALGHALDMMVVAEGVETQAQNDALRDLGCDLGQGYLLHRPTPADQISTLLAATSASASASEVS